MLEELENIFGDIKRTYKIVSSEKGYSEETQYLISIHNSGDSGYIYHKQWKEIELNDSEIKFVNLLKTALDDIPSIRKETIKRFEINTSKDDLEKTISNIKNLFQHNTPFINPTFWNFSANDEWESPENFKWIIMPLRNSKIKATYTILGEGGLAEKEVIVPPNTQFRIKSVSNEKIILVELPLNKLKLLCKIDLLIVRFLKFFNRK